MKEKIERAVLVLAEKIVSGVKSDDALRYTQAALNLMHAYQVSEQIKRNNREQ